MSKRFTIGTDPEFFLKETATGKLKSAIPFIEGTKHEPKTLKSGGTIQRDNVAVEFATPPAVDGHDFVDKVRASFMEVLTHLPKGYELEPLPSANFDEDQLDNPEARAFGCSPDYDAWALCMNEPTAASQTNFRSCGAHIHVGHVPGDGNEFLLDPMGKVETVKAMDLFHGIISTILDNSSPAIERRKLYGKAGCHRPTNYGLEYRVLSNYWMKSPSTVMLMDSLTYDMLNAVRTDMHKSMIEEVGEHEIQSIINDGKVPEAVKVYDTIIKPKLSAQSIDLFDMAKEHVGTYNFYKEWKLEA